MHTFQIPTAIQDVLNRMDDLESAVFSELPDLNAEPTTLKVAKQRRDQWIDWAQRIGSTCRGVRGPGSSDPLSLEELFDTRDGGATMRFAGDLLGTPPSFIGSGCGTGAIADFAEHGARATRFSKTKNLKSEWAETASAFATAYSVVVMQALFVVAWGRRQIRYLENAVVPKIDVNEADATVTVSLAGQEVTDEITATHLSAFCAWKNGNGIHLTRNLIVGKTRRSLLGRFPQLTPFVVSERNRQKGPGSNQSFFHLNELGRKHLTVR